jgi:hypothetical protein
LIVITVIALGIISCEGVGSRVFDPHVVGVVVAFKIEEEIK